MARQFSLQTDLIALYPTTYSPIMFKKQSLNKAKKTEVAIFLCSRYKTNEVGMQISLTEDTTFRNVMKIDFHFFICTRAEAF